MPKNHEYMAAAGLPTEEASSKIAKWQATQRDFLAQTGLKRQYGRERIGTGLKEKIADSRGKFIEITDKAIDSVKNVRISGYTEEQCLFIQAAHKTLLRTAKERNGSKEVAFIFTRDFSKSEVQIGLSDRLEFNGAGQVLLSTKSGLFVMHNHPSGKGFSMDDITFFIETDTVKSISVVGNNGDVYILTKNAEYDKIKTRKDLVRQVKKVVKTGSNSEFDRVVNKIIGGDGFDFIG